MFKPGQIANPNGRPKGSQDKVSRQIREMFRDLLKSNIPKIKEDLRNMTPKERVDCLIKISNFILPKLQAVSITEYPEWMDLVKLTPLERRKEIKRLQTQLHEEESIEGQVEDITGT